jgi:uncharacterized membrane protein
MDMKDIVCSVIMVVTLLVSFFINDPATRSIVASLGIIVGLVLLKNIGFTKSGENQNF